MQKASTRTRRMSLSAMTLGADVLDSHRILASRILRQLQMLFPGKVLRRGYMCSGNTKNLSHMLLSCNKHLSLQCQRLQSSAYFCELPMLNISDWSAGTAVDHWD